MSRLKRNLKIIWDETAAPMALSLRSQQDEHPSRARRFITKSLDGGSGWGVYDRRRSRFLKDREVRALSEEQLREILAN